MTDESDTVLPAYGYAGDISPQLAYEWWRTGQAVLVDIRTEAEIAWVGFVPGSVIIPWKHWPGMVPNQDFDAAVRQVVPEGGKAVLLCRSGVRSIAAARRATASRPSRSAAEWMAASRSRKRAVSSGG